MTKLAEYSLVKSPKTPGKFLKCLEFFWHNFSTRNTRRSIKGSTGLYYSLESNSATISTCWIGDDIIRWKAKHVPLMMSSMKNPKSKTKIFSFSCARLYESLEGLNSFSSFLLTSYGRPKFGLKWLMLPFVKLLYFCQKLGFWAIYSAPYMLESQSSALKMWITASFPKKTWAKKIGYWVGAQG